METLVTKFDLPAPLVHGLERQRVLALLPNVPGAVTAIVAPAGFGKSSILAAWVGSVVMPSASIRIDEADQDPSRFGRHLADTIANTLGEALPSRVHSALSAAGSVNAASRVTPLLNFIAEGSDLHLVFDDYHHASSPDIDEVLRYIIVNAPSNLRLCLTSRFRPDLGFKRLAASGRLTELTALDLAFDVEEVAELVVQITGLGVSSDDTAAVHAATEGWPVLVALLAHSASVRGEPIVDVLNSTGHELGDYVLEEVLSGLDEATIEFVRNTSILDQLSGPLADMVTESVGGGARLDELRRSGFPIDRTQSAQGWYRYHQHVAETLRTQLANSAPVSEIQELHRRAADWLHREGLTEQALRHAVVGENYELASRIVRDEWLERVNDGDLETVREWLGYLPAEVIERETALLLAVAWTDLMVGDVDLISSRLASARQLDSSDDVLPGASSRASGILLIEALYNRVIGRLSQACEAADAALELEIDPAVVGRSRALTYSGICRFWNGQFDQAARLLNHGAGIGERFGYRMAHLLALGYLGLIEAERKSVIELGVIVADAEALIEEAGLQAHPTAAPALAAAGLHQALLGNEVDALSKLEEALAVASIQSEPGLLAYLNLSCARLLDSIGQPVAADRRRRLADALCRQAEDVGFIAARCGSDRGGSNRGGSSRGGHVTSDVALTARETSVLLLLDSSLSLPEVASELFVSHNTVKTHVQSVYRKLGVSRREDAVRVAGLLGLS